MGAQFRIKSDPLCKIVDKRVGRMDTTRIRYLVWGVGGANGFAHIGALRSLERVWEAEGKVLRHEIRGAAGASVGAMVALAFVLWYRADELEAAAVDELEQNRDAFDNLNVLNLLNNKGLLPAKLIAGIVRRLIRHKVGNEEITFRELHRLFDCKLVFAVHNLTKLRSELMSVDTTPDMPVWKACTMSCLLPIIFESMRHADCEYVDGGVSNSLPYEPFPREATAAIHIHKLEGEVTAAPTLNHISALIVALLNHISALIEGYETATRQKLEHFPPAEVVRIGVPTKRVVNLVVGPDERHNIMARGELMVLVHIDLAAVACIIHALTVTREAWSTSPRGHFKRVLSELLQQNTAAV